MTNEIDEESNASPHVSETGTNFSVREDSSAASMVSESASTDKQPENKDSEAASHRASLYHNYNSEFQLSPTESIEMNTTNTVQSIGLLLRQARIKKNLSLEDVSRQLRLSMQQIDAIEREDYEKLPGRTFLRGFIRNYANLVQLDPDPLLQLLPESARVISSYESTPFRDKQISFSSTRKNSNKNPLIFLVMVGVLIASTFLFFRDYEWSGTSDTATSTGETKPSSKTTSIEIQLPAATVSKSADMIEPQTVKQPEPASGVYTTGKKLSEAETDVEIEKVQTDDKPDVQNAVDKPVAVSANPVNGDTLFFKFSADSWIKVVDGTGKPLFEQLKKGGSEQTITGKKPFSIIIGNASGVDLTYNDKIIDISFYKKHDGTARFKLD